MALGIGSGWKVINSELADSGVDLKGVTWAIRGNAWTRTEEHPLCLQLYC